jgi:molecular chaperone HtpG
LKFLEEESENRADSYIGFYKEFGIYLKEGIVTDYSYREQISKLLRFESSSSERDSLTSLPDYVSRMKEDQKDIYYLYAPDRESLENGPHYEAFKARKLEVLFLYDPIDEFVMNNLRDFDDKKLLSADSSEIRLEDILMESKGEPLDKDATKSLCEWLKDTLGDRVSDVEESKRLVESPALALNADKYFTPAYKRIMRAMRQEVSANQKVILEINTRHNLIRNLSQLRDKDPDLAKMVAEQLFDNALIAAGFLDDPRKIVNRVYKILERVSET